MLHAGIDLAWNTRGRTGLAVVGGSGALVESASVRTDEEIDSWLVRHAAYLVNVAVDAPLIVVNETGMRPAEKLIGAAFGKYDASCHASNTSKAYMNPPQATSLALRHGWQVDPAHVGSANDPACIEVYPHPATIGLVGLGQILKYKGGALATRQAAFNMLLDHLESVPTLGLGVNERWAEIRSVAGHSLGRSSSTTSRTRSMRSCARTWRGSGTRTVRRCRSTETWRPDTSWPRLHRHTHPHGERPS